MFNLFKKKLPPSENYKIVKVIEQPNFTIYGSVGTLYVYMFESNLGHKKIETKCETPNNVYHGFDIGGETYNKSIYPWLKGSRIADIPTYNEIIYKEQSINKKFAVKEIYKAFFE
jgi:hypothetical protein